MKIHHIALTVKDLEESSHFYCSNFEFKVSKIFSRPEKGWKAQFLQGDNTRLELFEFSQSNTSGNTQDISIVGIRHIAFAVDDIEAEITRLSHLEFTPIHEGVTKRRLAFTSYPNGIQIELYEEQG